MMIYAVVFLTPEGRELGLKELKAWEERFQVHPEHNLVFIIDRENQTENIARVLGMMEEDSQTHGFVIPITQMAGWMPERSWMWTSKGQYAHPRQAREAANV